jgi:hypothetical protein
MINTTLYYVQSDTLPEITISLIDTDTGLAKDLTKKIVKLHARSDAGGNIVFSREASFPLGATNRVAGICYIQWQSGDLNKAPGTYKAEIEISDIETGDRETIYDTFNIIIREDIGDILISTEPETPTGPGTASDSSEYIVTEWNTTVSGNLLANSGENQPYAVVSYTVLGQTGILGQPLNITDVGTLTIASNGNWSFDPLETYFNATLIVDYVVSNSLNQTKQSSLTVNVLAQVVQSQIDVRVVRVGTEIPIQLIFNNTPEYTWQDNEYIQDFYTTTTVVDDLSFKLIRERNTDRVELWIYRPPVWNYRSSSASYTVPNQDSLITADVNYDIQIQVNNVFITPVYSTSTLTRVRMATGTLRRLVSGFKPWQWSRIDNAIATKKLPRYDIDTMAELFIDSTQVLAKDLRDSVPLSSYSHASLGGSSSNAWWDGVRSAQGGAYASSRGIYHAAEARAISERVNGITTNLAEIEAHLRGAGEYAGTFPQYIVLDSITFKPHNPQRGNYKWTATPNRSTSTLPRPYTYHVQARPSYSWDVAHLYNCGQLAFEATRDPFYALLLQCNSLMSLAFLNAYNAGIWIDTHDPTLDAQLSANSALWNNLPYYILEQYQYRAWTHGLREVVKAYSVTNRCPSAPFLELASTFSSISNDDATYGWNVEAAQMNSGDLSSTNKLTVHYGAKKLLGIYGRLFDSGSGNRDNPYRLGYSGLFNGYALGNLFWVSLLGRSEYLPHFTRVLEGYCELTLNGGGGQRLLQMYPWTTKPGISNALTPTTSVSNSDNPANYNTVAPAPFSNISEFIKYWESNADTVYNLDNSSFTNNFQGNQVTTGQQFIMILRSVKQLNEQGYWNVIPDKVKNTLSIVSEQLFNSVRYSGALSNWSMDYTGSNDIITQNKSATTTLATSISGDNLLVNTTGGSGVYTITSFRAAGKVGTPSQVLNISNIGDLLVNPNGSWSFNPLPTYFGTTLVVNYTISDSLSRTAYANLGITIQPQGNSGPMLLSTTPTVNTWRSV